MSIDLRRAFDHLVAIQQMIVDHARSESVLEAVATAAHDLVGDLADADRVLDDDERRVLDALAGLAYLAANNADVADVVDRSLARADFDARHDPLTGMGNRKQAIGRLEEWAIGGSGSTVIYVDLDRFKSVNDSYGHETGDEILRQVANRLDDLTHADDLVARLASDEFLVLARSDDEALALDLARRIAASLSFVAHVDFRDIRVSASVGCARHIAGETIEDVLANAELAMSRAKADGGGRLVQFDDAMRRERTAELTLERELRFAVDHDEFDVYFQAVVDVASSQLVGAEALVRWSHPTRGLLTPGEFVGAAEAAGIVARVDTAGFRKASSYVRDWQAEGTLPERFRVGVNVSAPQFHDPDLVATVAAELANGVDPDRLWLEITETAMIRDVDRSLATMHHLRGLGVHLSVDDFGTGWSSLAYLKQFPVEALKIDQSFVAGLCTDADDHAIVEATIRLAGALSLAVVAEGVENEAQADELRRLGCQSVQGYFYSPPLPPDEFAARWLRPASSRSAAFTP